MNNTTVTFKTDKEVKEKSKALFEELGLDMSSAINIFLRQCIKEKGIPFIISTKPDQTTVRENKEADNSIEIRDTFENKADTFFRNNNF
ncbi:MAG: type II toxin-antitoxin system RelB/DinJ family antitoxin [Erysipelotrichaceae bacterium]|nr:type II toxin-antitoxin system RelB/DinJ family antitoxin [Erysipelotrichaceae bacterium]